MTRKIAAVLAAADSSVFYSFDDPADGLLHMHMAEKQVWG